MNTEEGRGWAEVLRHSPGKHREHAESFNPQQIIKSIPITEEMNSSLGKKILKMIKEYQKMLRAKNAPHPMLEQMQKTYSLLIRAVRSDVRIISDFQSDMIKVYWALSNTPVKEKIDVLITRLEYLMVHQVQVLRKINCTIQIQSRKYKTKEAYCDFCDDVEEKINKGEYKNALELLLYMNYVFDLKKAELLMNTAQKASITYPQHASDFLVLLKKRVNLRLFLPNLQNYSEFSGNPLLELIAKTDEQSKALVCCDILSQDAVTYYKHLCEDTLKNHFKNDILKEIELLSGLQKGIQGHFKV